MRGQSITLDYEPPASSGLPAKRLVMNGPDGSQSIFTFYDRIEIGRKNSAPLRPGVLRVSDPTISSRHCVITQQADGRCFVRDLSRNGTRLQGRRLSPNLKTEVEIGHTLSLGKFLSLTLEGDVSQESPADLVLESSSTSTIGLTEMTMVTVLVGDIRNYTGLVQHAATGDLQASVSRVFDRLEQEVEQFGGTLKEFQGDAIFAFWEQSQTGCHATDACSAALQLERLSRVLADDPGVWNVSGLPLEMDFALATGPVNISGYGNEGALGLSMVGECVVLAFRIEKFAGDGTGCIVVDPVTRHMVGDHFEFDSLGTRRVKGFDDEFELYSLVGTSGRQE